MKYWEIVADGLTRQGWSWGYTSVLTARGTVHIVDAHRGDSCRFIVHSDERLTAFLELERMLLREQ